MIGSKEITPLDLSFSDLKIGRNSGGSYFKGELDEIKVHRGTLDEQDLKNEYLSGLGLDAWSFENTDGNIVYGVGQAYSFGDLVSGATVSELSGGNHILDLGENDGHVEILNSNELTSSSNAFSISAWVKLPPNTDLDDLDDHYPIISRGLWTKPPLFELSLRGGDYFNGLCFRTQNSDGLGQVYRDLMPDENLSSYLNDDHWHHIAVTRSSSSPSSLKLYVDGFVVGNTESDEELAHSGSFWIGRGYFSRVTGGALNGVAHFQGLMDDLILKNSTLPAPTIEHLASVDPEGVERGFTDPLLDQGSQPQSKIVTISGGNDLHTSIDNKIMDGPVNGEEHLVIQIEAGTYRLPHKIEINDLNGWKHLTIKQAGTGEVLIKGSLVVPEANISSAGSDIFKIEDVDLSTAPLAAQAIFWDGISLIQYGVAESEVIRSSPHPDKEGDSFLALSAEQAEARYGYMSPRLRTDNLARGIRSRQLIGSDLSSILNQLPSGCFINVKKADGHFTLYFKAPSGAINQTINLAKIEVPVLGTLFNLDLNHTFSNSSVGTAQREQETRILDEQLRVELEEKAQVTIQGLTFSQNTQSSQPNHGPGAVVLSGNFITFKDNKIQWADYHGISGNGTGNKYYGNEISFAGCVGITMNRAYGTKMIGNVTHHCNWRHFGRSHVGGVKVGNQMFGLRIHNHASRFNLANGPGIWVDSSNVPTGPRPAAGVGPQFLPPTEEFDPGSGVIISESDSSFNGAAGIFYEISFNGKFYDNMVRFNREKGFHLNNTSDCLIQRNLVSGNLQQGIVLIAFERAEPIFVGEVTTPFSTVRNTIRNNIVRNTGLPSEIDQDDVFYTLPGELNSNLEYYYDGVFGADFGSEYRTYDWKADRFNDTGNIYRLISIPNYNHTAGEGFPQDDLSFSITTGTLTYEREMIVGDNLVEDNTVWMTNSLNYRYAASNVGLRKDGHPGASSPVTFPTISTTDIIEFHGTGATASEAEFANYFNTQGQTNGWSSEASTISPWPTSVTPATRINKFHFPAD